MSFKREGDDKSQLNILKKRRVADLLSNFIPEDEAALMKNGRYTCLVCSYRPVFDTVDMLTVHRKGKRHLDGLKAFYGKKSQLKNEITKRQHINYVQAEDSRQECSSSAPLLAQTRRLTHHALLKTVPYNSCHRKRSTNSEKGSASISSGPRACSNEQEKTCLKDQVSSDVSPDSSSGFTAANTDHLDQVCLSSQQLADTPDQGDQQRELENQQDGSSRGPGLDTPVNRESNPSTGNNGLQSAVTQEAELTTAQRRKELEHYLKLKSDGWIRDQSGQWIKDENVEFDSDEDEPPPLTLQPASH